MNLQTEISPQLWQAVERSYESQAWSNAILDSIHYLGDAIRSRTDLQSDGVALIGQALGGKAPRLRLNRLQTESEQSVQAGAEQLLRGLYQTIRNPRSHERFEDSRVDADALIVFVDYLLRLIGHAQSSFSLDESVSRILDAAFVPNMRYADLLVSEIPPRHRLQVALLAFRRRSEADGAKLRFFFTAIFNALTVEEQQDLVDAISTELRESSDESALRSVLQLLEPARWSRLAEPARLRTENRILGNLKDGRYSATTKRCSGGALATWSTSFWLHFTLKEEVLWAVYEKLRASDIASQNYALRFCLPYIESLVDKPPPYLQRFLIERLVAGDKRFKEAMDATFFSWKWSDDLQKALDDFRETVFLADEDDDLPF